MNLNAWYIFTFIRVIIIIFSRILIIVFVVFIIFNFILLFLIRFHFFLLLFSKLKVFHISSSSYTHLTHLDGTRISCSCINLSSRLVVVNDVHQIQFRLLYFTQWAWWLQGSWFGNSRVGYNWNSITIIDCIRILCDSTFLFLKPFLSILTFLLFHHFLVNFWIDLLILALHLI